jgi:hypothetical protein
MGSITDDLDALKQIVAALEPFEQNDKERIIRWACEKFGIQFHQQQMTIAKSEGNENVAISQLPRRIDESLPGTDIKSFVNSKSPKSDNQFTAVVAYYYQFVAPANLKKDALSGEDLREAIRQVNWHRVEDPGKTIRNAAQAGLFDKSGDRGAYRLNHVGENLVAMTLPEGGASRSAQKRQGNKKK